MPASRQTQFLGHVYGAYVGGHTRMLGWITANVSGSTWTYTAGAASKPETEHDDIKGAVWSLDDHEHPYYAFSLERTFMPTEQVPEGRQIVTTPPV